MVLGNTVAELFILGELWGSYLFSNQRKRGNCDNFSSCVAIHNIRSYLSLIGMGLFCLIRSLNKLVN